MVLRVGGVIVKEVILMGLFIQNKGRSCRAVATTSYSFWAASSLAPKAFFYRYRRYQNSCSIFIEVHCHLFRRDLHHYVHSPKGSNAGTSSILQSSCLQHWFKNWQEQRKNRLTASTFGGAIGFWPRRRVQLWLEKLGAIEPFTGNLATIWSNIKEEEALERYKLITGNSVSFPEFQLYGKKNPQDSWLACSPDGVVDRAVYGLSSSGVLEIKCPFFDGDKQRSYPWSRIPLYCMPQAQGLMEILDREWMDFYCWTLNGSSLFRLYRDREYWELIKIALSDFWWMHVQPARDFCSKSPVKNPVLEMKLLKPAPRHELCGAIVYASKCLVDESKLLMREIHGKLQTEGSWNFNDLGIDERDGPRRLKMRRHLLRSRDVEMLANV